MKVLYDIPFASNQREGTEKTEYKLDLFLPSSNVGKDPEYEDNDRQVVNNGECRKDGQKKKSPVVVFVHGGGWRRGGPQAWRHFLYREVNVMAAIIIWFLNTYSNVGEAFASNDVACAVISYPLSDLKCPFVFVELLACYIGCCLALLLTLTPVLIMTSVYVSVTTHGTHFQSWLHIWHQVQYPYITMDTFLAFLVFVNFVILLLFTLKRTKFDLSTRQLFRMWIAVLVTSLLLRGSSGCLQLLAIFITTTILTQGHILRRRLQNSNTTNAKQADIVAKSVKWIKDFAESSDTLDSDRIFLMGHSAGGHLVTLVTLDETYLGRNGCSVRDIKGVISLSGVYDLFCLDTTLLRPFYLFPPFGRNRNHWAAASPAHVLESRQETRSLPPFLLMCAEQDLMLKDQSFCFGDQLRSRDIPCEHIQIPRTNHFTIVTSLWKTFKGESISDRSIEFVK